jgi:glycosyltransferase involved in cell wall biosynthesis
MESIVMRVAIVHPWFLELGGGEKVVDVLAGIYPKADIFALSASEEYLPPNVGSRRIYTSSIDKLISTFFRYKRASFMALFPMAVEGLDVSNYDLIISSCGPAVMGVNPGEHCHHISYIHSPQRAWWDLYASRQSELSWPARQLFVLFASYIRAWEFGAIQRVDQIVSNSNYIAERVWKYFRRTSTVIYPPVDTSIGYLSDRTDDYYLSLSRLDKDKKAELLVQACNRLGRRLLVAGTGREEARLKSMAGPTIEFLGRVPDAELPELYSRCRALLFASNEDFGIAPVEAQSFGRPVLAYGHGGALETVRVNDPAAGSDTGVFFPEQTVDSVIDGILRFEQMEGDFNPVEIRRHSKEFDTSVFIQRFRAFVDDGITVRESLLSEMQTCWKAEV